MGLGLGRLANFINGELWGRPAAPWFPFAMVYPSPYAGPEPRYPSELIEFSLEGLILFIIMLFAVRSPSNRIHAGFLTGLFLSGYAVARIIAECFREPDAFVGFLPFGTTMGQILSIPMLLIGLTLILWSRKHPAP